MPKGFVRKTPAVVLDLERGTVTTAGPISAVAALVDTEVVVAGMITTNGMMLNARDKTPSSPGGYKRGRELVNSDHLKSGAIHQE